MGRQTYSFPLSYCPKKFAYNEAIDQRRSGDMAVIYVKIMRNKLGNLFVTEEFEIVIDFADHAENLRNTTLHLCVIAVTDDTSDFVKCFTGSLRQGLNHRCIRPCRSLIYRSNKYKILDRLLTVQIQV